MQWHLWTVKKHTWSQQQNAGWSAVRSRGNAREFHIAWKVVTLLRTTAVSNYNISQCYRDPLVVQLVLGGDSKSLYCIRESCTAVQTSGHWDVVQSTSDGYRSITRVQMMLSTAPHTRRTNYLVFSEITTEPGPKAIRFQIVTLLQLLKLT